MNLQGNTYKSINLKSNRDRLVSEKRLGDREVFSQIVDGKRYFSSLDAEIYLGDRFVDDVVSIQYVVQQNALKIYGYNSYTFDDVALGTRIVEGAFTINFTKSGFMFDVLRNSKPISRSKYYTDQNDSSKESVTWDSLFDKEHKPMWDRGINIKIGFGDQHMEGPLTTMVVLYCVQLTGCQMVFGLDGQAIGETYSFFARDIRYEIGELPEYTPEESKINSHGKTSKKNGTVKVSKIAYEKDESSKVPRWYLSMNIDSAGSEITSFKYNVSSDDNKQMSNTYINVGPLKSGPMRVQVPDQIGYKIEQCINKQKSMGVDEKYLELYTSVSMDYVINKSQNDKGTFDGKSMRSSIITRKS